MNHHCDDHRRENGKDDQEGCSVPIPGSDFFTLPFNNHSNGHLARNENQIPLLRLSVNDSLHIQPSSPVSDERFLFSTLSNNNLDKNVEANAANTSITRFDSSDQNAEFVTSDYVTLPTTINRNQEKFSSDATSTASVQLKHEDEIKQAIAVDVLANLFHYTSTKANSLHLKDANGQTEYLTSPGVSAVIPQKSVTSSRRFSTFKKVNPAPGSQNEALHSLPNGTSVSCHPSLKRRKTDSNGNSISLSMGIFEASDEARIDLFEADTLTAGNKAPFLQTVKVSKSTKAQIPEMKCDACNVFRKNLLSKLSRGMVEGSDIEGHSFLRIDPTTGELYNICDNCWDKVKNSHSGCRMWVHKQLESALPGIVDYFRAAIGERVPGALETWTQLFDAQFNRYIQIRNLGAQQILRNLHAMTKMSMNGMLYDKSKQQDMTSWTLSPLIAATSATAPEFLSSFVSSRQQLLTNAVVDAGPNLVDPSIISSTNE